MHRRLHRDASKRDKIKVLEVLSFVEEKRLRVDLINE